MLLLCLCALNELFQNFSFVGGHWKRWKADMKGLGNEWELGPWREIPKNLLKYVFKNERKGQDVKNSHSCLLVFSCIYFEQFGHTEFVSIKSLRENIIYTFEDLRWKTIWSWKVLKYKILLSFFAYN